MYSRFYIPSGVRFNWYTIHSPRFLAIGRSTYNELIIRVGNLNIWFFRKESKPARDERKHWRIDK